MLVKDMVNEGFLEEAAKILAGEPFLTEESREQLKELIGEEAYDKIKDQIGNGNKDLLTPDPKDVVVDVESKTVKTEDPTLPLGEGEAWGEDFQKKLDEFLASQLTNIPEDQRDETVARVRSLINGKVERKDAVDAFNERLDTALDYAILAGISEIYYAWVQTFAGGSYWEMGDPDQLTREDFQKVCQAFADACIALYDKLADEENVEPIAVAAAMKEHFAQALDLSEKGVRSLMLEKISELGDDDKQEKKAKRHSKHDYAQMSVIHGGLLNMGYAGCAPKDTDDTGTGDETEPDADDATKGLSDDEETKEVEKKEDKQLLVTEEDAVAWAQKALKTLEELGVTPDGSDKTADLDNNDLEETQKRLEAVAAELDQVQTGSAGLVTKLTEARDELRKRVEKQEAEAEAKKLAEEKLPDPLETRKSVEIPESEVSTKGKQPIKRRGFLEHMPTQIVEDNTD